MKYETHFAFNLFNELKNGKKIYALDKFLAEAYFLPTMEVEDFITLTHRAEADEKRFVFWSMNEEVEEL